MKTIMRHHSSAALAGLRKPIPFNRPFLTGGEISYIEEAVKSGKISGNGIFTKKCQTFFEKRYKFGKTLLTSSCTDALEMTALLTNLTPKDEVIVPSFTFVSSANAFVLRGAKIIFADSEQLTPNINVEHVEALITPNTKAIVVVHYGGVSCEMSMLKALADKLGIFLIEDAAHAINSFYKGIPLGSIGDLAAFSFHETKNIICGEGGMLVVNQPGLQGRAEILWEKGTNRAAFARGEVQKYNWVDVGSSFLSSEVVSAFLFAQLEKLDEIQTRRCEIWNRYWSLLAPLEEQGMIKLPYVPEYATVNGHLFYLLCENAETRDELLSFLNSKGIHAVFHYLPLHLSPFHLRSSPAICLENSERFSSTLIRLPLFFDLENEEVDYICENVTSFFMNR